MVVCVLFILIRFSFLPAQSVDDCMTCHEDPDLTTERQGKTVSLLVKLDVFQKSVHRDLECTDCHQDAAVEEFPHPEKLEPVHCGMCHDGAMEDFNIGVHGQALAKGEMYAPNCKECHGEHDILPPGDPQSRTYKMNVPLLCGKCHREGAPVAKVYNITEHNILENYSQSIHGKGLFKQGLIVTATCNNCHGNHLILPHTDPRSSISLKNIANTCMTCHAKIEEVHVKVIKGELWEKKPGAIPACTDCHPPHTVNRQNIVVTISDRTCLKCHEKEDVHKTVDGKKVSLKVNKADLANSVHTKIPCVKCHSDVSTHLKRPCSTAGKVDCSNCHADLSNQYFSSGHGEAYFKKDPNAPYCTDCHGDHQIKSKYDETSPTYRASVPKLCGGCHRENGQATQGTHLKEVDAYHDYSTSVHGRGWSEKGLLPSAICIDCHSAHFILKESDERSSVNSKNIPATCATCHKGIYDKYINSVHAINRKNVAEKLPTCADCHHAHVISDIKQDKFITEVTGQCGSCHKDLAESYSQTYHGKAYQLGYLEAAKCSDCHGAHDILNVNDPNSSVGVNHIVSTCQKCHADANTRFTGYLTHATHHDKRKYPVLFYTFWAMTVLLIGVFSFFGLHTLLWLPRSMQGMIQKRKEAKGQKHKYYIKRFTLAQRVTHLFVILSFMMLALTGMMLKFSGMNWAGFLSNLLGGVSVARNIHRFAAVITFGYFSFHLFSLIRTKLKHRTKWGDFIFGKDTLMFNKQDLQDFIATMKWFFGRGPRPEYGHWTYWEKFDYFAVFWGVAVIGLSGLMLWFPEKFTLIFPGWVINIAQIIHSDEALLAVGFIFTIHFFNTHLRPEAFPMDTVIFTGVVPVEEYKKDRPREYQELKESGKLRKRVVKIEMTPKWEKAVRIFGYIFLSLGLTLVLLIIYTMLFGYK